MERNELLRRVKEAVGSFDSEARVCLYGSRARGDAKPDSDWDFLILLSIPVDAQLKSEIRGRLYELELEANEVICSIIHGAEEWDRPQSAGSPFYRNVTREGIMI